MATDQTKATADPYQLDHRLTVLETRSDTILPTLATKADLADLKSELRAEFASLSRWMATLLVTIVLGFAGMFVTMFTMLHR